MKKIYLLLCIAFFLLAQGFSQPVPGPITPGAFCRGYLIDYKPNVGLNAGALGLTGVLTAYSTLVISQTNDLTGIGQAHVAVTTIGWDQWFFRFSNGSNCAIDLTAFPYASWRVKTKWAGVNDVDISFQMKGTPYGAIMEPFTPLKGDGQWHVISCDFSKWGPAIGPGDYDNAFWFNDTCTIDIDQIRFGNIGDPDSTIDLAIDTLPTQICEKDGGQQTINLTGISNGTDISLLSLTQTNTKTTILEGTPTFSAIDPAGTATMSYTPKAATIGETNVHMVLTYNRGDSVKKYKSVWFTISIVADPVMKVPASIKAQVNQIKAIMNVSQAVNSTGGASNLSITVSSTNPDLITNLVAETVKADGTSKITFIPGQDLCGTDVITAVITDSKTGRTSSYDIAVEVSGSGCIPPDAVANSKKSELTVTPNPASDVINVTLPDENGGKLIIVDITGKTVKEIIVPAGQSVVSNININQLAPGVYFISETSNNAVKKLIIR